ncbi:MAG: DUF2804 domain-containing protein [bacterium]|nr:DUF2804 domain-containing protein [bacterium]
MYKIIGDNNKVNYGVIDEPVDFNYKDFKLLNFFGKEIKGLKKKYTFHMFNYLGIIADDFLIGLACVDLGYMYNVFCYLYNYKEGLLYEFDTKGRGGSKVLRFPANPDEYRLHLEKGKNHLVINKSHETGHLEVEASFEDTLSLKGEFKYGFKSHQPLRVLNPSDPYRWTFTEKCSPILPDKLEITYKNEKLKFDMDKVILLYDWTGGYLKRHTNWYWAAFGGILPDRKKTRIGANFAAFVNETFFAENAFWINNKRNRVHRCVYDFNPMNLYNPWHIWDEEGSVDIIFRPMGERNEKFNGLFAKADFRQFVGSFEGTLKPRGSKALKFEEVHGFTEFHSVLW